MTNILNLTSLRNCHCFTKSQFRTNSLLWLVSGKLTCLLPLLIAWIHGHLTALLREWPIESNCLGLQYICKNILIRKNGYFVHTLLPLLVLLVEDQTLEFALWIISLCGQLLCTSIYYKKSLCIVASLCKLMDPCVNLAL